MKLSDRRKIQIFIILPAFLITLAYTLLTKGFYLISAKRWYLDCEIVMQT